MVGVAVTICENVMLSPIDDMFLVGTEGVLSSFKLSKEVLLTPVEGVVLDTANEEL